MVNPGVEGVRAVLNVKGELEDVQIAGANNLHWERVTDHPIVPHSQVVRLRGNIFIYTGERIQGLLY